MQKKGTFSLRARLIVTMALLVLLQSLALLLSLFVSRVFVTLDAEAFRLFSSATSGRRQSYDDRVAAVIDSMAAATTQINADFLALAGAYELEPGQLYSNDEAYTQLALQGSETLVNLLQGNAVSGAFFMLRGSNSNKQSDTAHSAVYIRNSAPESSAEDTGNYLLEVGPVAVSNQYRISTSIHWELDMEDAGGADMGYLEKPMWAAQQYKNAEIERYGYWQPPVDILGDGKQVICYTMPLVDKNGEAYGVVGIEISLALLSQLYLPNKDMLYSSGFYAVVPAANSQQVDLAWYISGEPLAQVYLRQHASLPLGQVGGVDIEVFETRVDSLGEVYCLVQPITMYSQNSPFYEESWALTGFVPTQALHETSGRVRVMLLGSIAVTTALAFLAVFALVFMTTRRIRGLSKEVRDMTPSVDIRFQPTGIREIDELTSAVEKLNRSVRNASRTTSKILELSLLPIGGYEETTEAERVVLTEYIYGLLGLPVGQAVTRAQWHKMREQLMQHPAQEYENTYRYDSEEGTKWLRIQETETDTGTVGVVLDVTRDVEARRRLSRELDYDALTHLYNRTAFKREAYAMIEKQPQSVGVMVFADLDNLKYINDTFGHDMGDRLIIRAGEMFRHFQEVGGVVSRISGDEFAIYLHGFSTKQEAREVIHRQYAANNKYTLTTPDGSEHKIRSSSGVAFYPFDSDNVTDLLKLSDYAMYEAKHNQKGSIFEFNMETYRANAYLLENREAINRLLDEGLIRFAFQPIVDLATGEIFAFEALMRPLLDNFKSPFEILSVAEAQSKLGQLERLVMLHAFQTVQERRAEFGGAKVFVNSIPSQMLSEEDMLFIERTYPNLFDMMVMEITEAENDMPQELQKKLEDIRGLGIKIALDDFGSGYSNEIRILSIAPDIVKIDIGLIRNIHQDKDKQKLVANLLSFCHPKGIRLIAEGVEYREELAELVRLGMDYVQGYYTGRPNFELLPLQEKVVKEIRYLASSGGRPPQAVDAD